MLVTYRFRIDDANAARTRRFTYQTRVPYPHAPRIGEAVMIPTNDQDHDLGARRVEDVIYTLDGGILLDFRLDGLVNDVDGQVETLLKAGYREVRET